MYWCEWCNGRGGCFYSCSKDRRDTSIHMYPLYHGDVLPNIFWCSRCSIFPIDIHRWDGSPPFECCWGKHGRNSARPDDSIGGGNGLKIRCLIAPFTEKSSVNSGLSIVVHNTSPELASGLSNQFVGQVLGGSYHLGSSERPWLVSPLTTFNDLYFIIYISHFIPVTIHQ